MEIRKETLDEAIKDCKNPECSYPKPNYLHSLLLPPSPHKYPQNSPYAQTLIRINKNAFSELFFKGNSIVWFFSFSCYLFHILLTPFVR